VCRELTKRFETTYAGTLAELGAHAAQDENMARGELVVVVAGNTAPAPPAVMEAEQVLRALLEDLPPSQAARIAARLTGATRGELYEHAVRLGRSAPQS
jgi:16S rRNA (cytidine1402-2'-O)-methyltransferase